VVDDAGGAAGQHGAPGAKDAGPAMTRLGIAIAVAALAAVLSAAPVGAERRTIYPASVPAGRPYSPGVLVGDTLYISGQLGLPGAGPTPAPMDAQARQAMDGIGAVLKEAGLGFQHLVKCHVYLANMDDYAAMNAAYGSYFTDRVPARTTVQAAALVANAGVEIGCIAFKDLSRISVVRPPAGSLPAPLGPYSPAVWAGDTLYVSGMGGQDPATKTVGESVEAQAAQTVANITTTLKAAGLGVSDVVWAQGYATRVAEAPALGSALGSAVKAPHGLVSVPRLPGPIRAELTFVATRGKSTAAYLAAATAPVADMAAEARQAFASLGQQVKSGGFALADVALVTMYLTNAADLAASNAAFLETFPKDAPARITIVVQPQGTERIRLTAIAAR
jgi:2-iminobutanoate/2-iminopropanoate deaminase